MLNPITRPPYSVNGTLYTQYWALWPRVIHYEFQTSVVWLRHYYSYVGRYGQLMFITDEQYLLRMCR